MKKWLPWIIGNLIVMAVDAALNGGVFWLIWHFRAHLWDMSTPEGCFNAALSLCIWPVMFIYHESNLWLTGKIPSMRETFTFGLIKKPPKQT